MAMITEVRMFLMKEMMAMMAALAMVAILALIMAGLLTMNKEAAAWRV
jgi:hypothetical protein